MMGLEAVFGQKIAESLGLAMGNQMTFPADFHEAFGIGVTHHHYVHFYHTLFEGRFLNQLEVSLDRIHPDDVASYMKFFPDDRLGLDLTDPAQRKDVVVHILTLLNYYESGMMLAGAVPKLASW